MAVAEREVIPGPSPWRCTRAQFYRMGDMGLFAGQRVELIEGEILIMPPISNLHRSVVPVVSRVLQGAFGGGYFISEQSPFDIGEDTDPEPDIAVIAGQPREYLNQPLTAAALIVEVSVSTLAHDRQVKGNLYAQADIDDYWIVNLEANQVEVHRRPGRLPGSVFGYAEIKIYQAGAAITPLAAPEAQVAVADLLP